MSRHAILGISAAMTALVLVLVGGVASYAFRPEPAPSTSVADTVPGDVVRAREAEYRRLLEDARARLRTSNGSAVVEQAPAPLEETASRGPGRSERREPGKHEGHGHHEERGEDDDG
jgi:hypothetical protein